MAHALRASERFPNFCHTLRAHSNNVRLFIGSGRERSHKERYSDLSMQIFSIIIGFARRNSSFLSCLMIHEDSQKLPESKRLETKPNLQTKITNRLLNIEKTHKGKQIELIKAYTIEAFNEYFEESSDKNKILDFVEAQLESESPKTRKLAKEFLKKKKPYKNPK